MSKEESYLNQHVKEILQPLVKEVLEQRPKEPVIK